MIEIITDKRGWKDFAVEAVVLGVFEPKPDSLLAEINKLLDGAIDHIIKKKEFSGEFGQVRLINTLKKLPCEHILLVGLGKRDDFGLEQLRRISGIVARTLRDNGVLDFATTLHNTPTKKATLREQAKAVAEGTILGAYQFAKYKTLNREKIKELRSITLLEAEKAAEEGAQAGKIIADAQCFVRDVVNEPASARTPARLAEIVLELKKLGIRVIVYDKAGIEKLGLNALLAVSRGSMEEPRFIVLEYRKGAGRPVVLVGKGITFDSGGLDIKLPQFMEDMKNDVAGAAAVIGVMRAVAGLGLHANVVGIIAATENMPGGKAYKPGDIIKAYNGRTMEIANTDAEGRVILSDTLAYAEKTYKPKCIIDIATLTGACITALGYAAAGLMSRNAALANQLKLAGESSGELVWELPMFEDYKEYIKSEVADVKNIPGNKGYEAGAIAGAWFLQHFVDKTPWAHIDIAGPAWSIECKNYCDRGATGFGVRLLVDFLKSVR